MAENGAANSGSGEGTVSGRRNRLLIGVGVAAAAFVVAIVVGFLLTRGGGPGSASPTSGESSAPAATSISVSATPSDAATSPPTDVPAPDRATLAPAPIDGVSDVPGGPSVRVTKIEAVDGEAVVPGEIAGPALRVTVEVQNTTEDALDLRTATVTLSYGDPWQVGNPVSKPEGAAFPASVAPGETASGTFVFEVPQDARGHVRVELDLSVDDPIIAFEGAAG